MFLSGKCCNQLGFIARISGLVKSRRLLLIIYQLHGIWNTCTNLLWLLATSVFHQKAGSLSGFLILLKTIR